MSRNRKKGSPTETIIRERQHEMIGVVFLLAAAIVLLSLSSFSPEDPVFVGIGKKAVNWIGLVGAYLAHGLLYTLGIASFLLAGGLIYGAVVAFSRGSIPLSFRRVAEHITLTVSGTIFCHLVFGGEQILGHAPGGVVGEYAGGLFVSLLSVPGTVALISAVMLVCLIDVTGLSPARTFEAVGRGVFAAACASGRAVAWTAVHFAHAAAWTGGRLLEEARELIASLRERKEKKAATAARKAAGDEPEICVSKAPAIPNPPKTVDPLEGILKAQASLPPDLERREPVVVTSEPELLSLPQEPEVEKPQRHTFRSIKRDQEPEIVIPRPDEKVKEKGPAAEETRLEKTVDYKDYQMPDIAFLDYQEQPQATIEKDQLHAYAKRLEEKLSDYGVQGRVRKIMPGPVVTMYEYEPAAGVKVSKISGLSDDLALALEALSVRIIAPIPGRSVVGIEVANKKRQTVYAKEIIGHSTFQRSRSKLTLALGKNIEGAPYVADLNKMPHLLVAGATGTGKSVALNTMITSILYRATPEDVRFILVDPKVLELSLYEGIPHLLLPVVTDPRKAQAALYWAVNEMERRIQLLHEAGVRSLDSYNKKAEAQQEELSKPKQKKVVVIDKTTPTGLTKPPPVEDDSCAADDAQPTIHKLPHIVIVIDELADLMMSSSREVETAIARIAQKARAAGIHLIIATQRPSVNVITGLIKANLPARISFRVAQKIDSRTILDQNGADTLLGNGDMLFHPPTSSQILRIHGALITEDEIRRVVEHLKEQAKPVYDETILASAEEPKTDTDEEDMGDHDELYDVAVQLVAEMGQASTSMVQRKLRIGYNRAARLIERMEKEGIVGPADGARPREVLVRDHNPEQPAA
jgi:S-DNA-T family DNA segregation ATPase FtsK/SpoIIIE